MSFKGKFTNKTVAVHIIEVAGKDTKELNDFLRSNAGRVLDIQTVGMLYNVCKFIIFLGGKL